MLCEAQSAGLMLDPQKVIDVLGGKIPYAPPDPRAELHKSLRGIWRLGEIWPKHHFYSVSVPGKAALEWKSNIRFNLARPRTIPECAHIHQSVFDRIRDVARIPPQEPAATVLRGAGEPCASSSLVR